MSARYLSLKSLTWIISTPPYRIWKTRTIEEFTYELEKVPKARRSYANIQNKKFLVKISGQPDPLAELKKTFCKTKALLLQKENKLEWHETEGGCATSFYLKNNL